MLDIRFIAENAKEVKAALACRSGEYDVDSVLALYARRKEILKEVEQMKAVRNSVSERISRLKRDKQPCDDLIAEMKNLGESIRAFDEELAALELNLKEALLRIPNLPDESVPRGRDESDNIEVRKWGEPRRFGSDQNTPALPLATKFLASELKTNESATSELNANKFKAIKPAANKANELASKEPAAKESGDFPKAESGCFAPKAHWEIGESLGILDPAAAAKITGARFTVYRGAGARLERALINFMLDCHAENGYCEILPPFMVNRDSMYGTGQLPKFEEDAFSVSGTNYFLVPTAEVPVTNLLRGDVVDRQLLPIKYCAYTACFRAEAGSAGRDTRGLIRQHQFNKVELVRFCMPEDSMRELELLTSDAERILQRLGLPYRVEILCSGDLGFASAKTYDLEVWMPSYNKYVEISSCSNYKDYQARRMNIKYRDGKQTGFLHTINGSGLAVGRTVAAIIENFQNADGSVTVPPALVPYLGTERIE